jgi:putative MFS transporter
VGIFYGRVQANDCWLYLGALIIILFGVLTGFATNFAMLVAFRVIVGFGLGGATIPFDLLAEFLPQSSRGQFLININYFW